MGINWWLVGGFIVATVLSLVFWWWLFLTIQWVWW